MAIVEREQTHRSELALMRRMAQGDEDAVRQVYADHADPLFRFVRRRFRGSVEDAEEIVSDVFVTALRHGASFEGRCSLFTWLCCIARSKIADWLRSADAAKRIPEENLVPMDNESLGMLRRVHDPSASYDDLVERVDRVRLVQALLESMTPEQREAVTLRYVEQFSVAEIAKIMSRSEKAVERLLERAKERPRQEMFRWFGEESFRMLCFDLLTL